MATQQIIKENEVNIGDLVFIHHISKPHKSGWWRKVVIEDKTDTYRYVLEKPVCEDYYKNEEDVNTTVMGTDIPSMLSVTLELGSNLYYNSKGDLHLEKRPKYKPSYYDILILAKGEMSSAVSHWNYNLNKVYIYSNKDIIFSNRGENLMNMLYSQDDKELKYLVSNMKSEVTKDDSESIS